MQITATLTFPRGYIAHPYWPEQEKLINIQKQSGVNRARTQKNREKALKDFLVTLDMSMAEYEELAKLAARPFYTNGNNGEIIIPTHQLMSCMVNAANVASSALRIAKPEQIRSMLLLSDLHTGKTAPDGVWERFVAPSGGTGQKLSNQRSLRSNAYIEKFAGDVTVTFDPDQLDKKKVQDFISYAGENVGVGASRKMGWGRFTVSWK